jgi:hypothetical protein
MIALLAASLVVGSVAASAGARTISATDPNLNGVASATYPGTVGRGVSFTTTGQASISDPTSSSTLTYNMHVHAAAPGEDCPDFGDEELVPMFEIVNNGTPVSVQGRKALDAYGEWTVCAYITSGSNGPTKVYAVGTISVTMACTSAQTSVMRAEAAVRSARRAVARARGGPAKSRARARLRTRLRQLQTAKRRYPARVAESCPAQ